jgi:nicotinate phosphoribosyltransferase
VGTSVVTGSGAPTAGFVYKLVAIAREPGPEAPLLPVAKRSPGKATVGGRKWAYRTDDGRDVLRRQPAGSGRPLQAPLPPDDDVEAARRHCAWMLASLPEQLRRLEPGTPVPPAHLEEDA